MYAIVWHKLVSAPGCCDVVWYQTKHKYNNMNINSLSTSFSDEDELAFWVTS